ncbi:MAG: hypothetical protein Q9187_004032 [Circinaria calcarea]
MIPSPSPTSSVRGTFVSGLTEGDLWRLDIFEGDEYERKKVMVRLLEEGEGKQEGEGREMEADTYVWIAGEENLEDEEWDFEHFCQEKIGKWVGGSGNADVQDVDNAVRAQLEDPTGGRGEGGKITKKLGLDSTDGVEGEKEKEILESAV